MEGIIHANDTARASQMGFDKESIIGLGVWMACVLYSSLRSASSSSKITMTEHVLVKDNGAGKLLSLYQPHASHFLTLH